MVFLILLAISVFDPALVPFANELRLEACDRADSKAFELGAEELEREVARKRNGRYPGLVQRRGRDNTPKTGFSRYRTIINMVLFLQAAIVLSLLLHSVLPQSMGASGATDPIYTFKDIYERLGVDRSASEAEIKKARKKLLAKLHPDRYLPKSGDPTDYLDKLTNEFISVNEDFDILLDKDKRANCDRNHPTSSASESGVNSNSEARHGYRKGGVRFFARIVGNRSLNASQSS